MPNLLPVLGDPFLLDIFRSLQGCVSICVATRCADSVEAHFVARDVSAFLAGFCQCMDDDSDAIKFVSQAEIGSVCQQIRGQLELLYDMLPPSTPDRQDVYLAISRLTRAGDTLPLRTPRALPDERGRTPTPGPAGYSLSPSGGDGEATGSDGLVLDFEGEHTPLVLMVGAGTVAPNTSPNSDDKELMHICETLDGQETDFAAFRAMLSGKGGLPLEEEQRELRRRLSADDGTLLLRFIIRQLCDSAGVRGQQGPSAAVCEWADLTMQEDILDVFYLEELTALIADAAAEGGDGGSAHQRRAAWRVRWRLMSLGAGEMVCTLLARLSVGVTFDRTLSLAISLLQARHPCTA